MTQVPPEFHDMHDDLFWQLLPKWFDVSLLATTRLYSLVQAVRHIEEIGLDGDLVECGCFRGGSMGLILELLALSGMTDRRVKIYDTFCGFPSDISDEDYTGKTLTRETWVTDNFKHIVELNMARTGYPVDKVELIEGLVEDTLPAQAPDSVALLHIDCDYYGAVLHTLETLYPKMTSGGFLQIDDYGHFKGARQAVDEYFADQPIFLHRIDYSGRTGIKP